MKKKILAVLCVMGLLAGCTAGNAENTAPQEAQETLAQGEGESPAEEAESEEPQETETEAEQSETALFQDYFDITSEGIDYLSVEGIQLPPGIRLSMVGKDSGSSFWKQVHEGAQQAVDDINKALGFTGDEKVQLNYDAPGDGDIAEQIDIIDQMLDKSPDALIIGFVDINSGKTQLELADSNGVPVFAVDSGIENSLIISESKTDNYQAGKEAAARLCELIGDEGQIALLVHSSETETGIEREKGFTDEIEQNHPNVEIVNVAYQDQDERSTDDIAAAVLAEYPELKAYSAMNEDTTRELLSALEMYGPEDRTITVTGFDAAHSEIESIQNGTLAGVMAQNPYGMGYASAVAAMREIARMENASVIETGYYWITAENLNDPATQLLVYK